MTALRSMAFITGDYPSAAAPERHVFVQQLVHAVARQGVRCTVIQPVPIHRAWNAREPSPYRSVEDAGGGNEAVVLRPRFLSMSARECFAGWGPLNPGILTLCAFSRAARGALRANELAPDAIYGHFLYLGGAAAVRVGTDLGIPAFPCAGESDFWTVRGFGVARARRDLGPAAAVMANSTHLKRRIEDQLRIPSNHVAVFPNGVDLRRFRPGDRTNARAHFDLPQDRFLIAFTGSLNQRKGATRIAEAIDGLNGVGGIFAGSGSKRPQGPNVVFCRSVSPVDMPLWLSAADAFVLPTTAEGSCNAIVEAMACGLPVISSTGAFNDDLLDHSMSVRVDPLDIGALRAAITRLRDDPSLRERLAGAALRRSRLFNIDDRARRMLDFMASRIHSGNARSAA